MLIRMQAELLYFALSIAAGVLAALFGGGMKWLHRRRRRTILLGVLDLLYWFLLGFSLFVLCFYQNSGIFRGYAAFGTLLGYGLFRAVEGLFRRDGGWRRPERRMLPKQRKKKRSRKNFQEEPEEGESDQNPRKR